MRFDKVVAKIKRVQFSPTVWRHCLPHGSIK